MKLRIATVAFNPGTEIETMVCSISAGLGQLATDSDFCCDTVIVNNGRESSVLDALRRRCGVRIVSAETNLGYGRAINLAARDFAGDWLLIVNPDVEFKPGAIATLLAHALRHSRGAVFGPKILTPEGQTYPSARRFPRIVSGMGHALLGTLWPANPFTRHYQNLLRTDRDTRTDWLSGACLLVRMDVFREVGGFDPGYFMFFEDTQLGEDVAAHGWESVYVPAAVVCHDQGKSWRSRPREMLYAHHASALRYLGRVYSRPWQFPLRVLFALGLKLRVLILTEMKCAPGGKRRKIGVYLRRNNENS